MKILITGVGGYIGSHAAYMFLQRGFDVVGIDSFVHGFHRPIDFFTEKFDRQFRFYEIDLQDKLAVNTLFKDEVGIEGVVHFAAHCSVNESMNNPYAYFSNNVQCTLHLLEAMKDFAIKNLVFSSTCAVYGTPKALPVDESHPLDPESPYGESKLIAEKMIKWYGKLFDIHYTILRYFNVCGAADDGAVGDSKKPSSLLMQNAVRGALGIAPFELTYSQVSSPDGSPVRDYINVVDLVEAHAAALDYLQNGGANDVFNIGTGKGNSVLEIVKAVQEITGVSFATARGEARKGESAMIYADTTKVKDKLHWEAKRSIKESVESLVKWYTHHPEGWEN